MNAIKLAKLVPVLIGGAGIILASGWTLLQPTTPPMDVRVPGMDKVDVAPVKIEPADLTGKLEKFDAPAGLAETKASWPHFRGPNHDNIAADSEAVDQWPKNGPARVWSINTGEGYAGGVIHKGRVYFLDYDQANQADVLRCLSLADGTTLWNRSYPMEVKRSHGMSRTVAAVNDQYIVTFGPKCHVLCVDAITGEYRWGIDLVAEYHAKVPPWYAGQCPLIDGDRVILAPGGDALMIAVEISSGKVLWKAPNPRKWNQTHSSIVTMEPFGKRTYVYCGSGGIAGISAEDGSILWDTIAWKVSLATVPAPVVVGEDRLFLSGGYKAGAMLLKLKKSGEKIVPEVVYRLPEDVFGAEQQTPIYYKGHLYGVVPPAGVLACLDVDTGKQLWNSGNQKFGIGPFMICKDQIWLVNDTGVLTIAEASPAEFRKIGEWTVIDKAHESWGPLAVADGRLLVRDLRRMVCLNLREAARE